MNDRSSVFSNLIWRFAERCGAQIVQFIVSIVLARLLLPETFGTVALVLVIAQIFQVFVDSGLGNALIQKKDADDLDFSSVFWFNVVWCLFLYGLIFITSPIIAKFYNDTTLIPVIRVLCITVIISGLKNVQQAYVSRTMQFKKFFFATLGGTVASAFAGIGLAYGGFGIWAIVAQKLVNLTIDTLVLWITVEWRPRFIFSFERLKGLLSYGWKLLASALLDTVYGNLRQLVIGRMYTTSDLAFYNQGDKFPEIITSNINASIDSVLLPSMAQEQDDKARVKAMTRRAITVSTYLMAPMMIGLAFCANSVITLILTDKWTPCVFYMRIFCITYMFYPIHTANLNAIKAIGRSDLFLKLECVKKIMGMILLLSTMWFGVEVMAYSMLISSLLSQLINTWPNRKLLSYGYLEQIRDILPNILLSIGMGFCVWLIGGIDMSLVLKLFVQILTGAVVYVSASYLFKIEPFIYLLGIIKSRFIKR